MSDKIKLMIEEGSRKSIEDTIKAARSLGTPVTVTAHEANDKVRIGFKGVKDGKSNE